MLEPLIELLSLTLVLRGFDIFAPSPPNSPSPGSVSGSDPVIEMTLLSTKNSSICGFVYVFFKIIIFHISIR